MHPVFYNTLTINLIFFFLGISTFFSLTSIAWSVSAYSDGLRLAYQTEYKRSGLTMLVHTLWQTAMLSGRVLAIVVFASHFKAWTFLVLGNVCIFQNNTFNLKSDKHFKEAGWSTYSSDLP